MQYASQSGPCEFEPSPQLEAWVETMAKLAWQKMSGSISAAVWPYRVKNTECLSLDMSGGRGGSLSVTFSTGYACCDYDVDDVQCVDMTDALVMASLLVRALQANTSLSVGNFI